MSPSLSITPATTVSPSLSEPGSRAASPTERAALMSWRGHQPTPPTQSEAVSRPGFMDHIARFTHVSPARQPAQDHAHHFWCRDAARSTDVPRYRPGLADTIRLDGILNSVQFTLFAFAVAGAVDALAPNGPTIFNPNGTRHEAAGVACLLGAVVAPLLVGTPVAGNIYGALLYGCSRHIENLRAHSISTRMAGYVASLTFFTAAWVGAGLVKQHINSNSQRPRLPEEPIDNDIYAWAGYFSLMVGSPGAAAVGWYFGRIGSAASRPRPQ
jgi:hypothetical protein